MSSDIKPKPLLFIRIISGPHNGEVHPIGPKTIIGRELNNQIVLSKDTTVSRQHAIIVYANNKFYIKNLSENNELLKNNKSINESKIGLKDIITLGSTRLKLTPKKEKSDNYSFKSMVPKKINIGSINLPKVLIALVFCAIVYMKLQSGPITPADGENRQITSTEFIDDTNKNEFTSPNVKVKKNVPAQAEYIKGFRDFKKGQYERGSIHFENCLAYEANHKLCNRYLHLSKKRVQESIQFNVILGRKYKDQKQYNACSSTFRNVAFMIKDKNDNTYKESIENEKYCRTMAEGNY